MVHVTPVAGAAGVVDHHLAAAATAADALGGQGIMHDGQVVRGAGSLSRAARPTWVRGA